MIRFSDDRSWDDLLPRLRDALSRGAFSDLAEAQRAFDLAADEPFEGDLTADWASDFDFVSLTETEGEIASDAIHPFGSAPLTAIPFAAPGMPRARTLRTELLERRDALSAMPVISSAMATATVWQAASSQATVWQCSLAGRAPAALVSMQEGGGQSYDRSLTRSSLRVVGWQGQRRAAPAVHDYALAELLADRAATSPADCLAYAVA